MNDLIRDVLQRNGVIILLSGPVGPEQVEKLMLSEQIGRGEAIERLASERGGVT